MTLIAKRQRPKHRILLAAMAAICSLPYVSCLAKELKLSDGSSVEILGVTDGTIHKFDTFTLADKAYQKLPKSVRDLLPPFAIQGGLMHMSGNDAVAVGIQVPDKAGSGKNYRVVLSDASGWYNSADSVGMSNDLRIFSFSMAPRSSPNVTLCFYTDSPREPGKLLGDITVPNPRFDPRLSSSSSAPPKRVVSGGVEMEILELYTNLHLPEDWMSVAIKGATGELTTPVVELMNGRAVACSFPIGGRSALVFKLNGQGIIKENLLSASLAIRDAKGSTYNPPTVLYLSDEQQVLAWWRSMPVTDGNYDFTITLHEAPPSDSPTWQTTELHELQEGDASPSTLQIAANTVTAQLAANPRRILLTSKADVSTVLAVKLEDGNSSTTLLPATILSKYPSEYDYRRKVWVSTVRVPQGTTTGPLNLKLARTIDHQLKFSGVPKRPAP